MRQSGLVVAFIVDLRSKAAISAGLCSHANNAKSVCSANPLAPLRVVERHLRIVVGHPIMSRPYSTSAESDGRPRSGKSLDHFADAMLAMARWDGDDWMRCKSAVASRHTPSMPFDAVHQALALVQLRLQRSVILQRRAGMIFASRSHIWTAPSVCEADAYAAARIS